MSDHRKKIRTLKELLWGFKKSDFSSFDTFLRSAFFGWLVFGVLVLGISLTLSFHVDYLPSAIKVGRVAPKDIRADQNYEIVDQRATEINRQEALKSVPPVFNFDENVMTDMDQRVH